MDIKYFFNPKSIAIIGVSKSPLKLSSIIFSNILESGFKGKIYPVNPKYDEIFGFKCYKNVSSIENPVELAVIAVKSKIVPQILLDLIKAKVKYAIIISAGFREIGPNGIKLEQEITKIARKGNIRILGPNCLGSINTINKLNASFATTMPKQGNIAFLTQSGAVATAMLDMALEKNVGFSHFVSLGNKIDIEETELIEYFFNNPKVKVVGAYLEEISNAKKLMEILNNYKHKKPFVLLNPGESKQAQQAMTSHTGAMSSSIAFIKALENQFSITTASNLNQMFNLLTMFSNGKRLEGNKIAIVTNAGGPAIIATDLLVKHGLEIAKISQETKQKLKKYLPETASLNNPIDVIGDALAERYKVPIDILTKDHNVDAIMVIVTPQLVTQIEETAKLIINSFKFSNKPIIPIFLGGKYIKCGLERLYAKKIPSFTSIKNAVDVLEKVNNWQNTKISSYNKSLLKLSNQGLYKLKIAKFSKDEEKILSENLVYKLLKEVSIPTTPQGVFTNYKQAINFAKDLFPIVLKVQTKDVIHKTDKKALILDISNPSQLKYEFEKLQQNFNVKSILVQKQITDEFQEVFIGITRDGSSKVYQPQEKGFGHLLIFGKGGVYTELYKDLQKALILATPKYIEKQFLKTKISKILLGYRAKYHYNINCVFETILKLQKLALLYPYISHLDMNPLIVTKTDCFAVDTKIFVKK